MHLVEDMMVADEQQLLRPAKGRTELEEELHEVAHIDYERVAIVSTYPGYTYTIQYNLV